MPFHLGKDSHVRISSVLLYDRSASVNMSPHPHHRDHATTPPYSSLVLLVRLGTGYVVQLFLGDMNKYLSSLKVGYLKQAKEMILRLVGEPESLYGVTYGNKGNLKAVASQKNPP